MDSQCDESETRTEPTNTTAEITRRGDLSSRAIHDPDEEKLGWNQEALPHDNKAAPVTILPNGARHEFDPTQNYVSWSMFSRNHFVFSALI